jgi:hypothetical protein
MGDATDHAARFDARFFVARNAGRASRSGDEVAGRTWWQRRQRASARWPTAGSRCGYTSDTPAARVRAHARGGSDAAVPGRLGEIAVKELRQTSPGCVPAGGGWPGSRSRPISSGAAGSLLIDPGDPAGPALDRAPGWVKAMER